MPRPAPSGQQQLNIHGKPLKTGLHQKTDPAQCEFPFAYIRDTAAVQQNVPCATGDAAGCMTSFDTASATSSLLYTPAVANRMLPYVRAQAPVSIASSDAITMAEVPGTLEYAAAAAAAAPAAAAAAAPAASV